MTYDCSNTISVANRSVQSEGFVTIMRSASFRVNFLIRISGRWIFSEVNKMYLENVQKNKNQMASLAGQGY